MSGFVAILALFCGLARGEQNPADYPMTISILDQPSFMTHSMYGTYSFSAGGHANLQDGDAIYAVDYGYDCSFRLVPNPPNTPYRAKWSKPQMRLKVLASVIGSQNKFEECEIRTSLHDGVYVRQAGQTLLVTKAEFDTWKEERKQRDPADYPLQISLIEENTSPSMTITTPSGATLTRLQASGRGNLYAGREAHGFEFTSTCGFTVYPKRNYAARWIVPEQKLEVLRTGAEQNFNGPNICVLTTAMKQDVYLTELGSGVTGTVSSEEFARENRESAPPAPSAPPANQDTNVIKVAVHSQPEGADIEVDGNYVGSTPSTIPLTPGHHGIVLRKRGFEDWERQIQFMGGETQVQADLEEKKSADSH